MNERRRQLLTGAALFTFLLWLPGLSFAQKEYEQEVPARQTETQTLSGQIAAEAAARKPFEGEEVTYAQVLADPDNPILSFRYAKAQVARGDVLGAAATLERILMLHPELDQVRLFYGLVLYRLDNLEAAQRELTALRERPMPESLRAEIDEYLKTIRLRRKATRFFSSTTVGVQYDTNRNASPSAKARLVGDDLSGVTGTARKRDDSSILVIQSLGVTRDLGHQAGHELFALFDYYLGEQTKVDDLDLSSFALKVGGVYKTLLVDLTPAFFASHTSLSRETFLREQGVELTFDRDLSRKLHGYFTSRWTREDFSGITENTVAPERKGKRIALIAGESYSLSPTQQVGGSATFNRKTMDESFPYNAYRGFDVNGFHVWLPGKGQFVINSLTWSNNTYDANDPLVSATRIRKEKQLRYRLTYGAPVNLFLGRVGWLAPCLKDTTVTASYEPFRALSNLANYTYNNHKFSLLFTKRVEW